MNLSRGNKLFRSKGESNIFPEEHLDEIIFIDRPFLLLSWARMFRCTVPAKRMIRERRVCVLPEGNSLEAYFEFLVNTALHLADRCFLWKFYPVNLPNEQRPPLLLLH